MPKNPNQKLKILYIAQALMQSDEAHPLTCERLIELLDQNGISAERKSIYSDLEALQTFGLDIAYRRPDGYFLASREFELPELRLLVDAVQCSRFITHKKSMELIKKLESLCGKSDAQKLNGQVFVYNRVKAMNESIYYTVDAVQEAIGENRQITFRYFDYHADKKKVYRHDGKVYQTDPCALIWEDENYYLVARENGALKHFRVDKMDNITVTDTPRTVSEPFDTAAYVKGVFGMFGGERENVKLLVENSFAGVILDRFGKDVSLVPQNNDRFTVSVNVAVSPQFFSWLSGLGSAAQIVSPASVREKMKEHLLGVLANY